MRVTDLIPRLILIFITLPFVPLPAQTGLSIPRPIIHLEGETVRIEYDLVQTAPSDLFTIRLEIKDSLGNTIDAQSLEGDIGKHISGGESKAILWDLEKDEIFLDEEIFFQVLALPEQQLMAGGNQPEADDVEMDKADELSTQPREDELAGYEETSASVQSEWSRAGLVLQSLALPGLGLSRVHGKPHWIRGAVGYGCIAGSVYMNRRAAESYDAYRSVSRLSDVDPSFRKATNQDLASEILAYTAIGIWAADLVWTLAGTSNLNTSSAISRTGGFSVRTAVQSFMWSGNGSSTPVPSLTIRYQF